jgi:hypothetical protein
LRILKKSTEGLLSPSKLAKDAKFGKVGMEKLYVNAIGPDGDVSTIGLFYSQPEAQKIVDMLRANPERVGYRYEIVEAVRHVLSEKYAQNILSPKE